VGAGDGPASDHRTELTLRGLLLGAAITLVFTAANVYLGLKVGLTFASTIPAAVISMAVLRAVKNSTIVENNIVQTVASAAGTLSAVIFVLPGLVMIGWWSGFPFWETFGVCAAGGILGVMYSVPLRRALVVQTDLPYPEGVAAAEVLKVGAERSPEASGGGLRALVIGSLASFGFAAVVASQLFTGEIDEYGRIGPSTTGIGFALSLALIGAGHLIGLTVGLAILAGLVIAWGVAIPLLTALHPIAGDAATIATAVWSHQVRFIGAGAIGVASIWTIGQLVKPVVGGLRSSIAASRHAAAGNEVPITERDLPIGTVALIAAASLIPVAILFVEFVRGSVPPGMTAALVAGGVAYVVVAGFAVAAACGYMAGLIGSSNSPVSGLAILAVIGASLLLVALAGSQIAALGHVLVAYSLFVTAILLCVATIANDNLQDLKTGQLVGATPWKQQVALIAGVIAGSLVIPPILNVLAHAYGFPGAPAHANMQPLAAPQATLISALARGVIQGQIDWSLIGAGAILGAIIVAIDEVLRKTTRLRLPPLAVGLGIYLPASSTAPVVVGAIAGFYFNRWAARQRDEGRARQMGVLVASGFIVGESLFGVLLAGLIVTTGRPTPLAVVGDGFAMPALLLGAAGFVIVVAALYRAAASLYLRSERRPVA
jgi:putative OPT family oligopeptide transporter